MARGAVCCSVVFLVFAAGCVGNAQTHEDDLIAEHRRGDKPSTITVPYEATYALIHDPFAADADAPGTMVFEHWTGKTLQFRQLKRGDPIGFQRDGDGQLVAVAGGEALPLEDGHYCWRITPETEHQGVSRVLHQTEEAFQQGAVECLGVGMGCLLFLVLCLAGAAH
jgi:hypothetical protein